jgi:hypothetical protein
MGARTAGAPVTGPDHVQHAGRLLAQAETMTAGHVGDECLAEMLERQRLAVAIPAAHGLLAVAAAIGLSANMDVIDASGWRDVCPDAGDRPGRTVTPAVPPAAFLGVARGAGAVTGQRPARGEARKTLSRIQRSGMVRSRRGHWTGAI